MSFWVFLDKKLKNLIVIFGISILEFAEMQNIVQNKKVTSILGPKLSYLGILSNKFKKLLSYLKLASSNL